jgi:hypothetical protein
MGVAMRLQEALPFMGAATATSRGAGLTGMLLVGLVWSFSALGATNSIAEHDNCLDKLQGMDARVPELLIVLVDLPGDNSELGLTEPLGPSQPADTTIPHLYLTHRVESMLDDVFDDEANDSNSLILASEEGSETQPESDASFPPIAEESEEHSALPGLEESGISQEGTPALPRFQRQMYRTDI